MSVTQAPYTAPPRFSLSALWQSVRRRAQGVFGRGDLSAVLIACALMAIPALSLSSVLDVQNTTQFWPISLNQLAIISVLSVLFGYLLARSHYGEVMGLLATSAYGMATIGVIEILAAPGDLPARVIAVAGRLVTSIRQIQVGGTTQDPFFLLLFLAALFWFLGHNTAWHIFRIDRIWRAIVPPAIVLMINGLYNFSPTNLDMYLILYMFLALLLVVRSHIDGRESDWYHHQVGFDRHLRSRFYQAGAIAGAAVLIVAWTLPTGSAQQNQQRFQQFINGDLLSQINKLLARLTTPLDTTGTVSSDYYGRDQLQLGGAVQLGDQPVLTVKLPPAAPTGARYYWQSRVFDTFRDNTWTSGQLSTVSATVPPLNLALLPYQNGTRTSIAETITMQSGPSRLVYAAPQVQQVSLAAEADVAVIDPTGALNVEVVRPEQALQAGDSYTAISSISVATADALRRTPTNYPAWIAPDLQVDSNTAPKARAEAVQIVTAAGAQTVYDKAKAIERWLRTNVVYDEAMPAPPTGADLIDWSLFTVKRGYCTYYASAMVIMLRSLHIPARMAAGFAQGTYDPTSQSYVVRERDAHTWVEVYFPDAGWVEFEPTAAQPSLNRPDSLGAPSTSTPSPTPSPTPTLTPTPQPTGTGSGNAQSNPPVFLQTPTSTPSPSATLLPGPSLLEPPTVPLPLPLITFLSLFMVVAIPVAIVSFIVVGALWWYEYRGLGQLSPVARAYARLTFYARWLRFPAPSGTTALERGRRWAREVPDRAAAITSITDLYVTEHYAQPRPLAPEIETHVNASWRWARGGLLRHKFNSWLPRWLRRI